MKTRVTTHDIARAAGVHQTTVSLALRGDPRLKASTIAKVKAAAERLGYRPDPMLSALASYRDSRRPARLRDTLAWVTDWETRDGWRELPMFVDFFDGACRRAAELGYRLEEYWLNSRQLSPERNSAILHGRGVRGLILAPLPNGASSLHLAWEHFCTVAIGPTLRQPALHVVSNNQFGTVQMLCGELAARGYRRIGYAIDRLSDTRMNGRWSAAFDYFQRDLPASRRVSRLEETTDRDTLRRWLQRERPDVIFGCSEELFELLQSQAGSTQKIPDFALIGVPTGSRRFSGIDENAGRVGETAAEQLSHLIRIGTRGIPPISTLTLIDGRWIDGETTRTAPRLTDAPTQTAEKSADAARAR
jgi:LacI family transcriptional regulator